MPFYQTRGDIPSKRHTVFKHKNKICYEELVSREGFSSMYTNLYHYNMPTCVKKIGKFKTIELLQSNNLHTARHFKGFEIKYKGDCVDSRTPILFNDDAVINIAKVNTSMEYFYKNGYYDELLYIQNGNGTIETNYGILKYKKGDYVIIPRSVIWKMSIVQKTDLLIVESRKPIKTPNRYRNEFGQLLEGAPFCERDIMVPELQKANLEKGDFLIKVRVEKGLQDYIYKYNPFDVIGWDGYFFPWILNINDFEPIVGSIHQPPPVHQTFGNDTLVICSFVSRLFDFHENAIPAPYPHSNVDSDEFIYYSMGDFMSRKGISEESMTLHPMGITHGPQPGKYEDSIGKKQTDELAVMVDTFKPLKITNHALHIEDKNYPLSWNK